MSKITLVILFLLSLVMNIAFATVLDPPYYTIYINNKSGFDLSFSTFRCGYFGPNPIPSGESTETVSPIYDRDSGCGLSFRVDKEYVWCNMALSDDGHLNLIDCMGNAKGAYLIPKISPDKKSITFTYYVPKISLLEFYTR